MIPVIWILEWATLIYSDGKQTNGCLGFGEGDGWRTFRKMEMLLLFMEMAVARQNSWNLSYTLKSYTCTVCKLYFKKVHLQGKCPSKVKNIHSQKYPLSWPWFSFQDGKHLRAGTVWQPFNILVASSAPGQVSPHAQENICSLISQLSSQWRCFHKEMNETEIEFQICYIIIFLWEPIFISAI